MMDVVVASNGGNNGVDGADDDINRGDTTVDADDPSDTVGPIGNDAAAAVAGANTGVAGDGVVGDAADSGDMDGCDDGGLEVEDNNGDGAVDETDGGRAGELDESIRVDDDDDADEEKAGDTLSLLPLPPTRNCLDSDDDVDGVSRPRKNENIAGSDSQPSMVPSGRSSSNI